MKKIYIIFLLAIIPFISGAQKTTYWTSGGEMIFSFARIDNQGDESGNIMRFSAFFHIQSLFNVDFNRNAGFFTGVTVRNIGFIYDVPQTEIRKKYRTYNAGIPVGIKLGKMDGGFFYAGYEVEFPLNYKEKTFKNEVKDDKFNVWFSDRVEPIAHGPFVGFQLPYGANIKFRYYLNNFFNKDYTETDEQGFQVKPYDIDVNIFYVSLSFNLFKDAHWYHKKVKFESGM